MERSLLLLERNSWVVASFTSEKFNSLKTPISKAEMVTNAKKGTTVLMADTGHLLKAPKKTFQLTSLEFCRSIRLQKFLEYPHSSIFKITSVCVYIVVAEFRQYIIFLMTPKFSGCLLIWKLKL